MVDSFGGFPPWLVAIGAALALVVGLWILAKLLKLALWLLFFGLILAGATAALWLLLR